jgi:uncharacterized OB-fold protein
LAPAVAVGIYRPASLDERGNPVCDWDEDSTTLAVDAARLVIDDPASVGAVTIVSRSATYLVDDAAAIVASALRLDDDVPVTQVQGGGSSALLALATAAPGSVVVALDADRNVGAAAVKVRSDDARPMLARRYRHSLPQRVRRSDAATATVYDDGRLMRERGWGPAIAALADGASPIVTGAPASASARFGGRAPEGLAEEAEAGWAAFVALADAYSQPSGGRVAALEGASGSAVDVPNANAAVVRRARQSYPAAARLPGARIAISLAAYERAFDAKVGLNASRCECGQVHYPPRRFCPACGRLDLVESFPLSHDATVYSVVTVRTPLPGLPKAYSLAVVDLGDSGVRGLVHVTGAPAGTASIGDTGRLVLRKVAEREGVPDYGYAFEGDQE